MRICKVHGQLTVGKLISDDVEMIDKAAAAATAAYNTPGCPWQGLSDIQVEMEFEAMQFIRELCPSY